MRVSGFPAPFVEKSVLSPWNEWSWHPCGKPFDLMCEGHSWALCPHPLVYVSFMPEPRVYFCSFVMSLKSGSVMPSPLFISRLFGHLRPLRFHLNVWMGFPVSAKCHWDFGKELASISSMSSSQRDACETYP